MTGRSSGWSPTSGAFALRTSVVEPPPHRLTAVYEETLPRQPLRFLLADDPGAGNTIMAELLSEQLIVRGDLERCLIVRPGGLSEQWHDELHRRFQSTMVGDPSRVHRRAPVGPEGETCGTAGAAAASGGRLR